MIEHPLPQNITSYQFHLIGNMTIKQFLIMLGGAGIGFLFYTTNLPGLIKWFFMIFFFSSSAAVAFIPYEDRTLDQWLINFVKAIYRPTKFYWRRQPHVPDFLNFEPKSTTDLTADTSNWTPQKRQQVMAYLSTIQSQDQAALSDPLDAFTRGANKVNDLFTSVEAAANVTPGAEMATARPNLQVRTRRLGQPQSIFDAGMPRPLQKTGMPTPSQANQASRPVAHKSTGVHQDRTPEKISQDQPTSPPKYESRSAEVVAKDIIRVAPQSGQNGEITDNPQVASAVTETAEEKSYAAADTIASSSQGGADILPAIFDRSLPFPSIPSEPNMLVGMAHDKNGKILPGAIIEILDQNGNTVRAMKTNSLGQFYISSPLKPGTYRVETEHSDHQFPVYQIDITNTALDPMNIVAKE